MDSKHIITSIPMFTGDKNLLDVFLNTCDVYMKLVDPTKKEDLLKVIKAKITGDALAKVAPKRKN